MSGRGRLGHDRIVIPFLPLTVQDFDWEGGAKLIDYQLLGEGQQRDANLSVKVKTAKRNKFSGGRGWAGEKLILHNLRFHPDFVASFSPPCEF